MHNSVHTDDNVAKCERVHIILYIS